MVGSDACINLEKGKVSRVKRFPFSVVATYPALSQMDFISAVTHNNIQLHTPHKRNPSFEMVKIFNEHKCQIT